MKIPTITPMKTPTRKTIAIRNAFVIHKKIATACCLGFVVAQAPLTAQSIWDGGGSDNIFITADNWQGNTAPTSGITTAVQFAGITQTTVDLNAAFQLQTLTFNSGAGAFTLGGAGLLTIQGLGNNFTGAVVNSSANLQTIGVNMTLSGATAFQNGGSGGGLTIDGNISNGGFSIGLLSSNAAGTNRINGVVSGGGGVAYNGNASGTTIINGVNTYTGATQLFNGRVLIGTNALSGVAGALGNSTSTVNLGATTSATSSALLTNGAFTVGRNLQIISPTNVLQVTTATVGGNTANVSSYTGTITMGSNSAAAQALTLTAVTGGRVEVTGNLLRATGATGATDTITKVGNGTVVLAGAGNTYTGITTVSAGTLLVNGTLNNLGATVTTASGATLGGTGNIQRAVSMNGTLATGDGGIGTLGTAAIDFNNGSTFAFELNTTSVTSDLLNANGAFNLNGTVTLSLVDLGANVALANDTKITIASYSGAWNNGTFNGLADDSQFVFGANTFTINYNDTTGAGLYSNYATLTVVPEPSAMALLASSLTALMMLRRRRI